MCQRLCNQTKISYLFHLVVKNCIDIASEELLRCYINNDEHVMLIGENFKIPIKLSVLNCFLPVMKKALETTLVTREGDDEKTVQLGDFDLDTIALFVKIIQHGCSDIIIEWDGLIKFLKFAHFYQSTLLLGLSYELGTTLITFDNFHEAIQLMELLDFDVWDNKCLQIILAGDNRRNLLVCDRFKACLNSCPRTTARVLHKMAKNLVGIE